MSTRRLSFALLLSAATGFVNVSQAGACCLTDWLFGRTTTPYYAGFAPIQTLPLSTQPIVTSNFGGNFANPYASNFATAYTAQPLISPVTGNGVFQAQRPAFGQAAFGQARFGQAAFGQATPLNNPSVFTGLPTAATAQAAYSAPIATTPFTANFRGAEPVGGSYLGASNTYPRTTIQTNLQTSFQNPSLTPLPTTNVTPLFPPTPARGGGLGQFFGSLFGTNYTSSYYQAPVTYYRPVTSIDPLSGTTVTVQQPCTSEITQVQRSPYSSLFAGDAVQPGQPASINFGTPIYTTPIDNCNPQSFGTGAFGSTPFGQDGVAQVGGVAPVGGSPGQFTVPIPATTAPQSSPFASQGFSGATGGAQPGVSPLSGSPTQPRSQSGGDFSPLDQPRLETFRAAESSPNPSSDDWYNSDRFRATQPNDPAPTNSAPTTPPPPPTVTEPAGDSAPKSYWQLQDADDSTAMIRPEPTPARVMTPPSFTAAEPIRALDSEPSPFELRDAAKAVPATSNFQAPPLPPASNFDPFTGGRAGVTPSRSIPVREAGLVRQQPAPIAKPAAPPQRDARWFTN